MRNTVNVALWQRAVFTQACRVRHSTPAVCCRERLCYRKLSRRPGYTSSYTSTMPKHLMFPDLHSPLCSLSQPQLSSGEPSPAGTQSRVSSSANSNDSLLGTASNLQHLARARPRPEHRPQVHAISLGDSRSLSGQSHQSSDAMSDRPLPAVPSGASANIDKSPLMHRRTQSSFCPEMMFGGGVTSQSCENMAAQSNVVALSDRDLILLDKRNTKTVHDTFRNNKSHYQSLNTIRSRKAKSRGGTPEAARTGNSGAGGGGDDGIFSASMHHLETSFDDITRETEQRMRASNIDSWVFSNAHLQRRADDPQLVISHINLRSPRPDQPPQRKIQSAHNIAAAASHDSGPSKTSSPQPTPASKFKLPMDPQTRLLQGKRSQQQKQGAADVSSGSDDSATPSESGGSPPHVHKAIPHNYQQLSTPFTGRRPGKPVRADIIRKQSAAVTSQQKATAPTKPLRHNKGNSNKALVTSARDMASSHDSQQVHSDADQSTDSNSMDAIFQSLTQIANKYGKCVFVIAFIYMHKRFKKFRNLK